MSRSHPFESIRKIGMVGVYSYNITLPKDIIRALGWQKHQRVVVARKGDTIVIKDWKPGEHRDG